MHLRFGVAHCNEAVRKACMEVTGWSPEYLFILVDDGAMLRYAFFLILKISNGVIFSKM